MKLKTAIICFLFFALITLCHGAIKNKTDRAKFGMAQSMINLSDFNEAEPILQDLYKKYPQDSEIAVDYIITLAEKHNYTQAIEVCRRVIKTDAKNKEAKIWLARLLSWNMEYDHSIAIYDEIIKAYPDWLKARREKARVLGWERRYGEAIAEYNLL